MSAISCIPVLMYHALEDDNHRSGSRNSSEQLYKISNESFQAQMHYLSIKGYQTCLLGEVLQWPSLPENAIVLTFDDGHYSNYDLALPILKEYGFRAEFFITTDWIGKQGYLSSVQIHKMSQSGMGIGSHGTTHSFFDDLTDEEVFTEFYNSRRVLCEITGEAVAAFSAPGGRINESIIKQGHKAGYKIICGSRFDYLREENRLACIPRLVVTAALNLTDFMLMAGADPGFLKRKRRKYFLLSLLKKILGNKIYVNLHSLASKGRQIVMKA